MEGLDTPAETLPVKTRQRKSVIFAVVYDSNEEGLKVQECTDRKEATAFVNQVGAINVQVVYKVSDSILPKVSATL